MKKSIITLSLVLLLGGGVFSRAASPDSKVFHAEAPDAPHALVLAAGPHATFSNDGKSFSKLKKGKALTQGAVVRSGNKPVDLFVRGWGTTIRLLPNTELAIDKLSKSTAENSPKMESLLNLKSGRIFCFLRAPVPNSKLEIQTPQARSLINTAAAGRYEVRADGAVVAGKSSYNQVRLLAEDDGTIIAPGQKFKRKDGHTTPAAPSETEMLIIEMDQLAALAEKAANENKGAGKGAD